jgi:hypothetical protein
MIDLHALFAGDLVYLSRTENGKKWHNGPRLVRVERVLPAPMADGAQVMVEYRQGWLRWVRPDQVEPARISTIERALFNRDPYDDEYDAELQARIDRHQWKYGAKVGALGPSDGGVVR